MPARESRTGELLPLPVLPGPGASHPAAPLLRVLQSQVLSRLEGSNGPHIVVARARRKFLNLPSSVQAVPLKLHGRRAAVRSSKSFERAVLLAARWPRDGMNELRISKLVIVVAGKAGIRAGDYVLQCPVGTIILLPAGVPHTNNTFSHLETLPPDVQHCSLLWLTPMMSGLACRACSCDGEQHYGPAQGEKIFLHRPQIMQLFNMLAEEAGQDISMTPTTEPDRATVLDGLALTLMRSIVRDIESEQFLLQEVAPEGDGTITFGSPIEQAVGYINTHYASALAIGDVARRFFFSRAQFTRKFREHTGQSFLEYLNTRRMEQARQLLIETDWTVVMITRYVGFGSSAYFHRIFLREVGMPPLQFRRQARIEAGNASSIKLADKSLM